MLPVAPFLLALAACCPDAAIELTPPGALVLDDSERLAVDLSAMLLDPSQEVEWSVSAGDGVLADTDGAELRLLAEVGATGDSWVDVRATDACGNEGSARVLVQLGGAAARCATTFTYVARGGADQVYLAGSFNDWLPQATPMTEGEAGEWSVTLELAPGAWPYKVVEADVGAGTEQWACDPAAELVQCDEGYTWDPSCPLGGATCNSMRVVEDCTIPSLTVASLDIDRDANRITLEVVGSSADLTLAATLDGADHPIRPDGEARWTIDASNLDDARYTLRVSAVDAAGRAAEPLYVPAWLDDRSWETGLMYYVFVDRFADGDTSLNVSEGASTEATDYVGGDLRGVIDRLDYLDELGVTVLWLTNPQDNAEGAFEGSCEATYSGYHGYWPSEAFAVEEHFGDEAVLRELIAEAHARNMRVLTDWVGNHVHDDHPYYRDHPEWFNPLARCGDANNWNDIPETCWFDSFLPDVRYYDPEPLVAFVDDAVEWVVDYELDGFRVDAVKHMPHAVFYNFTSRVRARVEHGGAEPFYTVGETFSGDRDLIGSYVNDRELDAQFDFPLYWAITAAFARDEIGLSNGDGSLRSVWEASDAAWGDAVMSTFLGNHDVARFIAQASGEIASLYGDSACGGDGLLRTPDTPPGWDEPYRRLILAWAFLLSTEGLPLVYYGDEIGLPGYNDPDNRQPMRFDAALSVDETRVLDAVRRLGQARRAHPALAVGERAEWWSNEAGFWAYARVHDDDAALVLLNRDDSDRTVSNGLAFAGLPQGVYRDVLTDDTFTSAGDSLTVTVPALGARVLVAE